MIRAAIVGLGWWGQTLVNAVQGKSDRIRFVAAHNRTRAKAEGFCRERGVALHDDVATILADPAIDAVVYAARHTQRADQVAQTAAAGKHVFVEKPFALDLASADAALAAAARAGVVLGVGYQRRFHPSMVELRARVRDGRLGTVGQCTAEAGAPAGLVLPKESWRLDPTEVPGGGMTALGVHAIDAMIELFGRIDELYCINRRLAAPNIDDVTSVLLSFASGMAGTVTLSMATAMHYRFVVFGTKGIAEVSLPSLDLFRFVPAASGPMQGQPGASAPEVIETKGFDAVRAELEVFASAIADRTPHPITPEQIRHGVAVFEAIVRSSAEGRPVKVAAS